MWYLYLVLCRRALALAATLATCWATTIALPAHAGALVGRAGASVKIEIANRTQERACDLDLTIQAGHDISVDRNRTKGQTADGDVWRSESDPLGTDGAFVRFLTDDCAAPVDPGESLVFQLDLQSGINQIRITQASWSDARHAAIRPPIRTIPGFKVEGDPMYTIFNDQDATIEIRDLRFLVDVAGIPLDDQDPGAMSGFGAALPAFLLGPGEARTFFVPGLIDPGNWMYAQGLVFDPLTDTLEASFIHGHQEVVPVPPTWSLLLVALVAAGLGWPPRRYA